jgi:hypothetical protein
MVLVILPADAATISGAPADRVAKLDVGPLAVQVFLPAEHLSLSDAVEVAVVLSAPEGVEVAWPSPPEAFADAKVLSTNKDGPDKVGRFLLRRWTLRLEPMKLGVLRLGVATVRYRDANAPWSTGEIPLGSTTIVPGPTSSDDVSTLRPSPLLPPEPAHHWSKYLIWGGAALFAFVLLAFLWTSLRAPSPKHGMDLDPWSDLEAAVEVGSNDPRELIRSATDLVRRELEIRFGRPASRQSTPELLSDPALIGRLNADQREALSRFLATADVEKFGRRPPTLDDARQCVRQGKEILAKRGS